MNVSALLTSAGINTAICVVFLSLYSILRKQPSYVNVYFGRRLASLHTRYKNSFCFDRFVPSPSWILKAWETSEEEILTIGGLDAVVFSRIIVFSIRIFSVAAIVCIFLVLPVNYQGQKHHREIHSESLDAFSIGNVKEGSKWLWVHFVALHIISCSACALLYFEYKSISGMRLSHITRSPSNPCHFTVLVRAIPWSSKEPYSESVRKYFTKYHTSTYLSHQMVYRTGTVQQLMNEAENMCKRIRDKSCKPRFLRCGLCGRTSRSFKILTSEVDSIPGKPCFQELGSPISGKECAAAFVFFKTRFAAVVASQILQSSNPMLWVTDLAPESHDVYWSNLWIPYRQLWIRKLATLLAAFLFVFVFIAPVTLVQGLIQLDDLQNKFQLKGIFKSPFVKQLVTGYLPSVILMSFLYTVPPIMMVLSAMEGPISHSGRKKSACCKVLYFTIWNVFFLNCLFGSVIKDLDKVFRQLENPKEVLDKLSQVVPGQASFFMTYILTSGWASLSCEIMQPFLLLCKFLRRLKFKINEDSSYSIQAFPYHTEVPRVLLLGLLGFTCSIMSPLILPFLLIYFSLAYLVYKNQFLNVYTTKYESGGQFWPIAHNTTIFSIVLTQFISIGVFGLKNFPVASGLAMLLVVCTLLFHFYCTQRFYPIFKNIAAEIFIEMDQLDEQFGRLEQIYEQLPSAYSQFLLASHDVPDPKTLNHHREIASSLSDPDSSCGQV